MRLHSRATETGPPSRRTRVLDPTERTAEVLFGLIMVLTFTGSLGIAQAGRDDVRAMLIGALGCNIAWGIIDAVLYLMACLGEQGHNLAVYRAVRRASDPEHGRLLIAGTLPPVVASALDPAGLERVRLNVISHLLEHVPYKDAPAEKVEFPRRKIGRYTAIDYPFKYVPERF